MSKKHRFSFYYLLVFATAIGYFCMVFYAIQNHDMVVTQTEGLEKNLELEPRGVYRKQGFGDTFFIYRFNAPNDNIVCYQISDNIYLVGDDEGNSSYACKYVEGQFLALSERYMLFLTKDGKTAVAFEEVKDAKVGETYLIKIPFYRLSKEEKEGFVYPVSCEEVENK